MRGSFDCALRGVGRLHRQDDGILQSTFPQSGCGAPANRENLDEATLILLILLPEPRSPSKTYARDTENPGRVAACR